MEGTCHATRHDNILVVNYITQGSFGPRQQFFGSQKQQGSFIQTPQLSTKQ